MSWFAPNLIKEKHCFFDARGGFSGGKYASMNVSTKSDDNISDVWKNLEKAAAVFGCHADRLHLLKQGVSSKVEYVSEPTPDWMEADGAVTDKPEVILCIRTADCAPVLLADYKHGIIGAAHAGWRGAFAGVIENTVALMLEKGACPENMAAAVGPCIGQASYEVDDGFYALINQPAYFVAGRSGHWQFDLPAYCADKLKKCGIADITVAGIDTYVEENGYFSFRRNSQRGLVSKKDDFPVEMSAIVL